MDIQEFITRSQHKIADISSYISSNECICEQSSLLWELSNFVYCLTLEEYVVTDKTYQHIDYYVDKADLLTMPIVDIPLLVNNIIVIGGNGGGSTISSVYDIPDYLLVTNSLIQEAISEIPEPIVDPLFDISFTVNLSGGKSLGKYTDGQQVTYVQKNLDFILKDLGIEEIPPTYTSPTATLTRDGSTSNITYEVGTNISPSLLVGFNQNDAGNLNGYSITRNGTQIFTGIVLSPYVDSRQLLDETLSYQGLVSYNEGPIKNTDQGNPYPDGHILAGSINTPTRSITGYRKYFYGVSGNVTTSSGIRALTNSTSAASNGTTFNINIPVGATRVQFAYLSTLRDVNSVKYVELSNTEVKTNFTQTLVNVEGANGYLAVSYKVYEFIPVEPFTIAATYQVTI